MNVYRKLTLLLVLVFVLLLVIPAPVQSAPHTVPDSLAYKAERVFWSDVVPSEDAEGHDILTFTSGDLYMEMLAQKSPCFLQPLSIYWEGIKVAEVRCRMILGKRGAWIGEVQRLYNDLPPDQQ